MEHPTLKEPVETDSAPQESAVERMAKDPSSRKRFLRMVGGTGAAGALGLLIAACGEEEQQQGSAQTGTQQQQDTGMKSQFGEGDLGIVNYALTLEYLEAQFYRDVIESGVIEDKSLQEIAKTFGEHEQTHVDALEKVAKQLGTPAEKPKASFQKVIDGGAKMVLETAATVENVGAAAYLGQVGAIQNPEILKSALAIHTVEAEHAAALNKAAGRSFMGQKETLEGSLPNGAFAKPLSMEEVLKQVQPFLQS